MPMEFFCLKTHFFLCYSKIYKYFTLFYREQIDTNRHMAVASKLQRRSSSLYLLTPSHMFFPCHHVRDIGHDNEFSFFNTAFIEDAEMEKAYDISYTDPWLKVEGMGVKAKLTELLVLQG